MTFAREPPVISDLNALSTILVVADVEEIRDGIQRLLLADGYHVNVARDEEESALKASLCRPDLILTSLGQNAIQAFPTAVRLRNRADLGEEVPVVVFSATGLDEGTEVAVGHNVYLTHPDNFNQLRTLLAHLLRKPGSPP